MTSKRYVQNALGITNISYYDRKNGLPSRIYFNGTINYIKDGVIHRDNKPAIIESSDKFYWWKDGMFLRNLRRGFNRI